MLSRLKIKKWNIVVCTLAGVLLASCGEEEKASSAIKPITSEPTSVESAFSEDSVDSSYLSKSSNREAQLKTTSSKTASKRLSLVEVIRQDSPIISTVVSPDNQILFGNNNHPNDNGSYNSDDNAYGVGLWSLTPSEEKPPSEENQTLTTEYGSTSIAVSPDGQTLVAGDTVGGITIFNLETEDKLRLQEQNSFITSVAISPDGQTLASGSTGQTIKLWNLPMGQLLGTLSHSNNVSSVAISPDGQTLASGSHDQTVKLWDLATGTLLHTLEGHDGPVTSVAISPDGQTIASGSHDQTIKLWNVETGEELQTIEDPQNSILSIAISPDGQLIVTGGTDGKVKLWDFKTGELIPSLMEHSGQVYSVTFSPDGETLVSAGEDRLIKVWR